MLLLLASAVASYALARHYAGQVYDRWLWDSAMSLAQLLYVHEGETAIAMTDATARMFRWDTVDQVQGQVVDGARTLFGDHPIPAPAQAGGDGPVYYDTDVDGQPVRAVQVAVPVPGAAQPVRVRVSETRIKRHRLEQRLLLSSLPLQALVLLLAAVALRWGTAAVAGNVNRATQRLAAFDVHPLRPLPLHGDSPRELQPALDAINTLIGRLAATQQQQQRFVANAAHQLRTPLAALQVRLDSALRETDPDARQAALGAVLDGLTRLHHLTHQILMLNRSETAGSGSVQLRPLDLAQLCRDTLERHADRAIAQGTDLGYDGPEQGLQLLGEAQLLREMVGNLIDNALRYGRRDGQVTLSLSPSPLTLYVDDDGPGIPADEHDRVLERFYRLDTQGDGCGLGLSIVSEIANLHGALFRLARSPAGGVRATVVFPPLDGR
nr:sensor histidine kinase [Stenotrophomonas mori]